LTLLPEDSDVDDVSNADDDEAFKPGGRGGLGEFGVGVATAADLAACGGTGVDAVGTGEFDLDGTGEFDLDLGLTGLFDLDRALVGAMGELSLDRDCALAVPSTDGKLRFLTNSLLFFLLLMMIVC
jgi:hypothetical protein